MLPEPHEPFQGSARRFWVSITLAVATLVLGTIGLAQYEEGEFNGALPLLGPAYGALQMLLLNTPNFERPVNGWLEAGRWCGAAFLLWTAAIIVWKRLRQSELRLWLKRLRDHYVICGFGQKGLEIAHSLLRREPRAQIVVIDPQPDPHLLASLGSSGVFAIPEDATHASSLRRARIEHAREVFIVSPTDDSNVAIAGAVRRRLSAPRQPPAFCHVHLSDIDLRDSLQRWNTSPTHAGCGCEMHFFDVLDNEARRILAEQPLDETGVRPESLDQVHMVLLGFGRLARSLVLRALKMGHFANARRLRVSIVTRQPDLDSERFYFRYPALAPNAPGRDFLGSVEFCPGEAQSFATRERVLRWAEETNTRFHLFLCLDEDARAIEVALRLRIALAERGAGPLLVRVQSREALTPMLPADNDAAARILPFGMVEDTCAEEAYLSGTQDRLAEAIHHRYLEARRQNPQPTDASDPALRDWKDLREDLRESNRQQADHLPVKLRAIGCALVPTDDPRPAVRAFEPVEIDVMAVMEHARWCAERLLAGWRFGSPSNKELRITENLVSWADLPEVMRDYDRRAVTTLPGLLADPKLNLSLKVVRTAPRS